MISLSNSLSLQYYNMQTQLKENTVSRHTAFGAPSGNV